MLTLDTPVAHYLDGMGLAIGASGVEVVDFHQAEHGYVHHSQIPVFMAALAQVSPAMARGRFPSFSFIELIQKRPSMDEIEARAVAMLCGTQLPPRFWEDRLAFGTALWEMIDRHDFHPFFQRMGSAYGDQGSHYLMRPRGFDWEDPDQPENPAELKAWRSAFRARPIHEQLLVATILQLYFSRKDPYWMVRVPNKWHAVEGINALHAAGVLDEWAGLYSRYGGW